MASELRLCVVGATGWLGGLVTGEAAARGHAVTGLVRAVASITDEDALTTALEGHDALLGAYRAPAADPGEMPLAARTAIAAAGRAGVRRVVWIGGTGTLRVPGGDTDIVDLPEFPAEWKAATLAHREALRAFRNEGGALAWTYVAVPRSIEPGKRTGAYRIGRDELLVDEAGESRISAEDFAVAVVDLLESGDHAGELVTVAY